jgi:cytochrome c biogenesis protein CcdA
VIDPIATTIDAIARHDLAGLPMAFAAGAVTSVGPCVAPRYVALAAVVERNGRRVLAVVSFVAGLLLGYAALGFGLGIFAAIARHTAVLYALLATGLVASGIALLVRRPAAARHHVHHRASTTGMFALGAGSALIVSPCCTPIVAAIAGMGALDGRPAVTALFLTTFALGHALPLLLFGATGSLVAGRFAGRDRAGVTTAISGVLMLALGAYYGVLA